jgi:tetratricopeptide (TPR) repeat protein
MSGSEDRGNYMKNVATLNQGNMTVESQNLFFGQIPVNSQPVSFPINVPRSNATEFMGREKELKIVHENIMQSHLPIALYGTGGIGKTELAIQYSLKYQKSYEGGICWLLARDTDVVKGILGFARSFLGIDPPQDLDIRSQLEFCWSRWREGKVLIIFDDVNDFDRIRQYLPPARRFSVLITTRLTYGFGVDFVEIPVLDESVALGLLRTSFRDGDSRIDEEIDYAQELCQWLDYLPLGLELVGRYLARKQDLSLSEMLERLKEEKLAQKAISPISTAFDLSWKELSDDAKHLSYYLSLFALAPIPWLIIENLQFKRKLDEIEELRDDWLLKFSLLQRQETGLYQFHHLVREYVRNKRDELDSANALKKSFCSKMVNLLVPLLIGNFDSAMANIPTMLITPHIEEIATAFSHLMDYQELYISHTYLLSICIYLGIYAQAAEWGEKFLLEIESRFSREDERYIVAQYLLTQVYSRQGDFTKAEKYLVELLEPTKNLFGNENAFTTRVLSSFGTLLATKGQFENAEKYCREALEIQERLVIKKDINTTPNLSLDLIPNLSDLAYVCRIRGNYKEAESLYERLFALKLEENVDKNQDFEKYFLINHEMIIHIFINNSTLYLEQSLTQDAENFCEQAKEMVENIFENDHPIYAICLSNLAQVCLAQGRHQEAEEICQKAIEINKSKDNTGHPTHAINLMVLGTIYTAQGRYDDAEILYIQALEIQKRVYGQEHVDVAESLVRLAVNYTEQNNYEEAKPLLTRGQEIYKSVLGTNHPKYGELLCVLANVSFSQKEFKKTEELLKEAVEIFENTLGNNHPKLVDKLIIYANFLVSQDCKEDAEPLYLKSLEVAKKVYGEDNPNVCEYMLGIAEFKRSLGQEEEAESMYAEAIGIYGKDKSINPNFSEGLMRLIELYEFQNRYDQVVALYNRLLKVSRELLGNKHPNVVNILNKLAKYLTEQRSYEKAARLYEESLEIRKCIFKEKHPSIANNMVNLAYVYQSLEKFDEAEELYRKALEINSHEYGESHQKVVLIQKALVQLDNKKCRKDQKKHNSHIFEDNISVSNQSELLQIEQSVNNEKKLPSSEIHEQIYSQSEPLQIEQPANNEIEVPSSENSEQSEAVKSKSSEIENLKEQNIKLENELKQLQEQQEYFKVEIENSKNENSTHENDLKKLQEQQKRLKVEIENYQHSNLEEQLKIKEIAQDLIRLTQEECAKLYEPLRVVLNDLERDRQNYQQTWDKLQEAIQQFNKYKEETDEISFHLHAHYQADCTLDKNLLPLDRQKVDEIIQKVSQLLAELDKQLSDARIQHERSKQKSIVTF